MKKQITSEQIAELTAMRNDMVRMLDTECEERAMAVQASINTLDHAMNILGISLEGMFNPLDY